MKNNLTKNNLFKFCLGIPTIEEYKFLIRSSFFKEMENFSNNFVYKYKNLLYQYGYLDSLHHWSRQYEYCFVYYFLLSYIKQLKKLDSIKVLDAGSGFTFFPFYLIENMPYLEINCVDIDSNLKSIFTLINKNLNTNIIFNCKNIEKTDYLDNYFDVIYCISVIEHTKNPENILLELKRILKPGGLLLLTFDISLDNKSDLKIDIANKIINQLNDHFYIFSNYKKRPISNFYDEKLLNTSYFLKYDKKLLPWKLNLRYILSIFKNLILLKKPKPLFKNLTVYCASVIKP